MNASPLHNFLYKDTKNRSRKNRDNHGEVLTKFVKNGFICKTIPEHVPDNTECICPEFTISKKNWICFIIYRIPVSSKLTALFEELNNFLTNQSCP